jgi:hypothetical protein
MENILKSAFLFLLIFLTKFFIKAKIYNNNITF